MKSAAEIWNTELTRYTSKWSNYFDVYDRHLTKFRENAPVVVEIGVDCGGSLEGWKKFFGLIQQ